MPRLLWTCVRGRAVLAAKGGTGSWEGLLQRPSLAAIAGAGVFNQRTVSKRRHLLLLCLDCVQGGRCGAAGVLVFRDEPMADDR